MLHSSMSSYHDASYVPSVWCSSQPAVILHPSGYQNRPEHLSIIMTKEPPVNGLSDKSDSSIADLVQSDDRFLDQLEVMHYLNFSDF